MIIIDKDLIDYKECLVLLEEMIEKVRADGLDRLILARHHPVYTVGSEGEEFGVDAIKTDRGGSITYHDEGCLMVYFAFKVANPPLFYRHVVRALERFFSFSDRIYYDPRRPGFYIEERKIASLGFRYKKGVSKHGVSIHIDPDLAAFNRIKPCGLDGVRASSLQAEGIGLGMEEAKRRIVEAVKHEFCKA